MPYANPSQQRPPHQPPRSPRQELTFRVTVVGGIALALFAILFFRVWFLQVLSGDEYLAEANDNRTRVTVVPAPRGEVRDRDGEVLVANRASLALQVDPHELPADPERRQAHMAKIAAMAELPERRVRRTVREQLTELPGGLVTLERDIDHDLVYYVAENQDRFPALQVERVFVRNYSDLGEAAAHIVGSVGEVTAEELEDPRYRDLEAGDTVGKQGVESAYDEYLRGRTGESRIQVDAMGRVKGQLHSEMPIPGGNLRLSLEGDVQRAGAAALSGQGLPGAFVVMDIDEGEILGLGSSPTFDPTVFTRPLTHRAFDALNSEESGAPMLNRATQGLYPTGSSFKPVTAVAALSAGLITPQTVVNDTGLLKIGDQEFRNAGDAVFGPVDLVGAIGVSSDVFFYLLGQQMDGSLQLQNWARRLGFGEPTGIDLPGEFGGLVPTPEWRNELAAADDEVIPWSVGHNIQLAIGQGDLQATPLQLATAYAAIANGGTVVTPHLGKTVEDAAGRIVREFAPPPAREVEIAPAHADAILAGMNAAAQTPGGTAYDIFAEFPVGVAGKTGTAERPPNADQAWFAAVAPYPNPEIVAVVTFEQGGFGADTAAPAVASILSEYFEEEVAADDAGAETAE